MSGNNKEQEIESLKGSIVGNCGGFKINDTDNVHLHYTNRRKIKVLEGKHNNTYKERKIANEQEFEELCLHIQECSISKKNTKQNISNRRGNDGSTSSSSSCSCESQVEEFRNFVQAHGGHYGGWKVKDHLFFLKVRSKYPLNKTAETINVHFPDISIDSVLEHDAWYCQYTKLRNANKLAIEQWKKTQKPIKVEKKQEPIAETKSKLKRDPNIKQKIEIWRAKTLAANLEKLEEHRLKELLKRKEEENKRKLQEEKKALVNHYLEEKMSYNIAVKTAEEIAKLQANKEAAQRTARLLKYFRFEDRRFIERKKSKNKQEVREVPKRTSLVCVKRDPNRLLWPTQGWIYRTKKNEVEGTLIKKDPLYINHLKKLAKPAWAKSITR